MCVCVCVRRKKEHEQLETHQGLKEELEKIWKVKLTVVLVVIGTHGTVTLKTGRVAPPDPEKNFRDLSLEECSPRSS